MKKRIIYWLLLKLIMPKYVKEIEKASEIYAISCWSKQHDGESYMRFGRYNKDFSSIQFAFIDGYNKALYDNGLTLKNGVVVKDIERFI